MLKMTPNCVLGSQNILNARRYLLPCGLIRCRFEHPRYKVL